MTDLGTLPGATGSDGTAINDAGDIVGNSGDNRTFLHAFLFHGGVMTDLGTPPDTGASRALAVNNRQQVVGYASLFIRGRSHAFLWQQGNMLDLNWVVAAGSGWELFDASGINDDGWIVGTGVHNGLARPFLLTPIANRALSLNGTTGFAEVPSTPDLNITGDWTVEARFKDEDPNGFNHDYRQIIMKGDRNANPEAPYFVLLGHNHLVAGVRTGGQDYALSYDLTALRLNPGAWHHVAVSFDAAHNWLDLFVDGQRIYSLVVPAHSTVGNSLPVEIGRSGPATGKYWLGKLDDVRIWNVARTGSEISANYRTQLSGSQPGLVANWNFDDGGGTTAVDSAGDHTAVLFGGAGFSVDVHP